MCIECMGDYDSDGHPLYTAQEIGGDNTNFAKASEAIRKTTTVSQQRLDWLNVLAHHLDAANLLARDDNPVSHRMAIEGTVAALRVAGFESLANLLVYSPQVTPAPVEQPQPEQCPTCLRSDELTHGHGRAGGGFGPWVMCDCGYFAKRYERVDETLSELTVLDHGSP